MRRHSYTFLALALALALAGCNQSGSNGGEPVVQAEGNQATRAMEQPDPRQRARDQARQEAGELRFVVDLAARKLQVHRGDRLLREDAVAIGKKGNETPEGKWRIQQVDINPDWVPPDSDWAEDRDRKAPGEEGNPMGRARLVFDKPYTIHGTDNLESLGSAESHGSIRVANQVVLELAQLLLQAGGAWEGDQWFRGMTAERSRMHQIKLPEPVPIEVR